MIVYVNSVPVNEIANCILQSNIAWNVTSMLSAIYIYKCMHES